MDRINRLRGRIVGAFALALFAIPIVAAQRADGVPATIAQSFVPVVSQAVGFGISRPLSEVAVPNVDAAPVAPFVREMPEPTGEIPDDRIKTTPGVIGDAAVQREAPTPNMPSPSVS